MNSLQFVFITQLDHGLDVWQGWSDRNFSQVQDCILGLISFLSFSAGVVAALIFWLTAWAAVVLFIVGIDQVERFVLFVAPVFSSLYVEAVTIGIIESQGSYVKSWARIGT